MALNDMIIDIGTLLRGFLASAMAVVAFSKPKYEYKTSVDPCSTPFTPFAYVGDVRFFTLPKIKPMVIMKVNKNKFKNARTLLKSEMKRIPIDAIRNKTVTKTSAGTSTWSLNGSLRFQWIFIVELRIWLFNNESKYFDQASDVTAMLVKPALDFQVKK
jgi:hypothetical protein